MATLVHDDLIDGAEVRRGRASVWSAHGVDVARATGDYLFARAFGSSQRRATSQRSRRSSRTRRSASFAARRFSAASGTTPTTSVDAYLERCGLKTAKLFEAACVLGGGESLREFGANLGIVFQIVDDILDCTGETIETGKVAGTDLRDGTPTLPLILAAQEDALVRRALAGGPQRRRARSRRRDGRARALARDRARLRRASAHVPERIASQGARRSHHGGRWSAGADGLSARPHLVREHGAGLLPPGLRSVDEVQGVPTALNGQLLAGELDVAPISSIEYARNADRLRILPRLCVSSEGAVDSIQLVSKKPLEHVRTVAVTPESATSVVLTKVLLPEATHVPLGEPADAKLLIGDAALKSSFEDPTPHHDLGRLWLERTGLPMVFAVWAAPEPVADSLLELQDALVASVRAARAEPETLALRVGRALRLPAGLPRALLREAPLLVRAARARRAADVPRARARGRRARPGAGAPVRRGCRSDRLNRTRCRRGRTGHEANVKWVYVILAIIILVAIWLAFAVIKWLFILAVAAGLIWVLFALRRRLAR